ncbi:hypothetical protein NliqN6_4055 [Naganishia liquefaciens]|uniref:GPI-anchored wall transfer protein n=1 Tax=Naganishia liquefaciens TaxID=104408 RepID=A0A8H3YFU9_9TREE|nr:hypothetical protein NliqN6_4055 [Naganishia liquefaciens]
MAYKQAKELFVAHGTGSSIANIHAVSSVGCTSYLVYAFLVGSRVLPDNPVTDYLVVFLPLLLAQTICAAHPYAFNAALVCLALLARLIPSRPTSRDPTPTTPPPPRHRAFLTTWRAHMMCMTVIAILAVDFPLFPRAFAKTEDYGTSLMDVGVGSFVLSQGLASSASSRAPSLRRTVKQCLPVIALGMIRVIMVKGVDYPEHITEYGVHWNFFFTLAATPILAALLAPVRTRLPIPLLIALILLGTPRSPPPLHSAQRLTSRAAQTFALRTGLEQWVIQPETTSRRSRGLAYQNKEGLVSLPGYFAIYLIGNAIGRCIVPTTQHPVKESVIVRTLVTYAATSWLLLFLLRVLQIPVSRRLANAPYAIWTAAFNATFLLGYYLIERHAFPARATRKVPALLEWINMNGLVLFLVANLLTGAINVAMESMYASDRVGFAVLVGYTAAVGVMAWGLRGRRIAL